MVASGTNSWHVGTKDTNHCNAVRKLSASLNRLTSSKAVANADTTTDSNVQIGKPDFTQLKGTTSVKAKIYKLETQVAAGD